MASTVLPNGTIIPEKYSRDWYNDLYHNWQELDNLLGGGTPKDGTLTIQKNGDTVGTFSANQSTNETIDITVPDVNNATLTIQQNGTNVQTFTANQSTNATANITVPTKTSDLTNDSGFITEDTTKIPLAGSNQISGDLIPATTGSVNLGTSTNKWKSLNGINPGALSLPSTLLSAMIRIDTTSWVLDGETDVEYTPLGDGYLTLANNQNLEWARGQITNDNNFGIYRFTYKYDSVLGGIQGFTIPCIKGKKVVMKIKGTGFYNALFVYCQGNV